MKILGTGLTGLVGTRFKELLGNFYEINSINLEEGVNILDRESILKAVDSSNADIVIHMAAKTNVDGCEEDKIKDEEILKIEDKDKQAREFVLLQSAWAINVIGTKNIVEACQKTGKKLIYISTDFVFDGTKKHYKEEDKPNPLNWYAKTKYEGEKLTQLLDEFLVLRLAYPYRANFERNDFVRAVIERLGKGEEIKMVYDHIIVPTFVDDFVNAIDVLIQKNEKGIFHVVGSQSLTPYDAAVKIAEEFNLNRKLILKTTRKEYFKDRAQRPFCLNLKNDKISHLGVEMSDFDNGIKEIKTQREIFI